MTNLIDLVTTQYFDHIRNDYCKWQKLDNDFDITVDPNSLSGSDAIRAQIRREMAEEFCTSISIETGSKYIKVCTGRAGHGRSVHSFILMKDDAKFKAGDILKPASWAAPARNFARGNIFAGNYSQVTWTGPT